jgi:hypothetical protein
MTKDRYPSKALTALARKRSLGRHSLRSGFLRMTALIAYFPFIFAQESRSVTVRLNTSAPGLESIGSLMKYAVRSN